MEDCVHHWYIGTISVTRSYGMIGASHIQKVPFGKKSGRKVARPRRHPALLAAGVTTLGSCGEF
jgi:hypothetical protein